ncbi:hypothetical protein ACLB2K_059299 [Fragaria x ananassa]
MMSYRDKLERSVSLIPAAAALGAKDRAALVKALESLVGQHSARLESPELKKRIAALTEIQGQLKDLKTKFVEERAALKARQNRCQAIRLAWTSNLHGIIWPPGLPIFKTIRDKIIPHAVSLFTGEAIEWGTDCEDLDDDDDLNDDEYYSDDD